MLYNLTLCVNINLQSVMERAESMFDRMENLKIIYALHKSSKPYTKVENRSTHSFFIRVKGSNAYNFAHGTITANEGDLVFIPKHSSYDSYTLTESSVYTAIHFDADFKETLMPCIYSLENFHEAEYISNHFADMWNLGTQAEKYQCLSLFYSLLSYLSSVENSVQLQKSKSRIIEPAVEYLRKHIYDCNLKADKLHRLCGISNTYFRQIFRSHFGTTPQNYIISKRISHAKAIISSGDFNNIGEVALSVGFNDPLYFSKVFKKAYGISPSEINNVTYR